MTEACPASSGCGRWSNMVACRGRHGEQAKDELQLMLPRSPRDSDYLDKLTYLRWLVRLPWHARDEERIDVARTMKLLDEQHWGLAKAKRPGRAQARRRQGGDSLSCRAARGRQDVVGSEHRNRDRPASSQLSRAQA